MISNRLNILSTGLLGATLVLVLACSPKASPGANTSLPTPAPPVSNPVLQYQVYEPASEADLKQNSHYGYLIVKTRPGFQEKAFLRLGFSIEGRLSFKGSTYYHLHKDAEILDSLKVLKVLQGVLFAQPDQNLKALGGITLSNPDPLSASQGYSLNLTKTLEAWKTYGFGPNTPRVVDIDTGINWAHEDFQKGGKSIVQHAYSWFDLDTGSEVTPTTTYAIEPIDYLNTEYATTDDDSHGSHTAGIMSAQGNNGKGMAGVCWNADLVSYKALQEGRGDEWSIYGSLYHLLNWKKQTGYTHTIPVNMSLGGSQASSFAIEAIEACEENNIVVIASMGNSGQNGTLYPAAYQGVIAVGATNGQDKKVHFSTSGPHISVTAPGYDIISCGSASPTNYLFESGTSMSAPFVTGLVAYMLTFNPDLTPAQIKTYLEANADFIEGAKGFTETNGWGRVNALKTIGAVVADLNAKTMPPSNYLKNPLRVTVQNVHNGITTPLMEMPVYLYQTDILGRITNFVSSGITSSNDASIADPLLNPAGTLDFNLLRPGTYVARCNIAGTQAHSEVITVTKDTVAPKLTVEFNQPFFYFQTLPDDAPSSLTADDIVSVWDPNTGELLAVAYHQGGLATTQLLTNYGRNLLVNVWYYYTQGEYALWVGEQLYAGGTKAPGTFASPAPGGFAGSASQDRKNPQPILPNTLYNGIMRDDVPDGPIPQGDWYIIPTS